MTQTNDPPLISSIELIPDAAEKADLDAPNTSGGKLVIGQAPNITITETNVVADADERLALDVQEGDIAIQTNVSTSFIFTGGDNIATNWETLDFDAVGAINGEDISPRDITASGDISLQDLTVAGAINGADTSAAAAGEALTSDGSGSFLFASVGGIEEVATFGDLPAIDPPQLAYVTGEDQYYHSNATLGAFDITQKSLDTSIPTEEFNSSGIAFNNDGTRFYEVPLQDVIYQFTLSTPFDITTASSKIQIDSQDDRPVAIAWNDDGTRLYEVAEFEDEIYQYTVSTPFDIATASFTQDSIPTQDGRPRDIAWNNDGTRLYEIGDIDEKIYQYTVSTPFEITTASFDTSIPSQPSSPLALEWNNDGTRLYESGFDDGGLIYQSTLSTPFDITTASFTVSVPSQGSEPVGIAWNDDGSRFYEMDNDIREIYQLTVDPAIWEAF